MIRNCLDHRDRRGFLTWLIQKRRAVLPTEKREFKRGGTSMWPYTMPEWLRCNIERQAASLSLSFLLLQCVFF